MSARAALQPPVAIVPARELDDDEREELEERERLAAFVRALVTPLVEEFGAAEIVAAVADACTELSTDHAEEANDMSLDALERADAAKAREVYLSMSFNLETAAQKTAALEAKLEEDAP